MEKKKLGTTKRFKKTERPCFTGCLRVRVRVRVLVRVRVTADPILEFTPPPQHEH